MIRHLIYAHRRALVFVIAVVVTLTTTSCIGICAASSSDVNDLLSSTVIITDNNNNNNITTTARDHDNNSNNETLFLDSTAGSHSNHVRTSIDEVLVVEAHRQEPDLVVSSRRSLQSSSTNPPYYVIDGNHPALGLRENWNITIGNPLKGLCPNAANINPRVWPANLPASVAVYKLPLNRLMLADPDVVGEAAAFNFTYLDAYLQEAANYSIHAIIRFFIQWPGTNPFYVPSYLFNAPYSLQYINNGTNLYYDDPVLKKAINQTIQALGRRYDGDSRIYMFQAGFFGAWGEWHTQGCTTALANGTVVDCFPDWTATEAIPWFRAAFKKTLVQIRQPYRTSAAELGFGYHDDSFTYTTLGGFYNGNVTTTRWFFWNVSLSFNVSDFWKKGPMGGEVRPENSDVFTDNYPAYTPLHQDFGPCTQVTHTSYMIWGRGWSMNNGTRGVSGSELARARNATVRMGYNFEVDSIAFAASQEVGPSAVDVAVTIKQTGFAPFYYNLNVTMFCTLGTSTTRVATTPVAIDVLLEYGDRSTSVLRNIPTASTSCFQDGASIEYRLESTYLYANRRIKWAQGDGTVILTSAVPISPTQQPSATPSARPSTFTRSPTVLPSAKPSARPSSKPSLRPSSIPSSRPSRGPYWILDLYFVNITSGLEMRNIGPIQHLANYKSTIIGRGLGLVAYTNTSLTGFKFLWPVNKARYDTRFPYSMGARTANNTFSQIIFLANNGPKAIDMEFYIGSNIVQRAFINFTIST